MKILEFLDEGILLLNIGIVVISVIRLLYGQLKLTYILKMKGGYIEKYRLNGMKYLMAGLSGVGVLAGIIEAFLLCREYPNPVQKIQSLGQSELILWIIVFLELCTYSLCVLPVYI